MRGLGAMAVLAIGIMYAADAVACPSCTTAKTGNGYLIATAVLLALPFTALAGFALWLRRSVKTPVGPERSADRTDGS